MAETQSLVRLVHFAAFEADLLTGELRKDGVKLKFSGQPFQVLAILLEHAGEVVTREELQKRLWPDTFVDVERNLNTAVNKIREVLGDSAENPRFIETLPRRGYRFIGEVQTASPAPSQPVIAEGTVEAVRGEQRRIPLQKIGVGGLIFLVIALAALIGYRRREPQRPEKQAVLTAVPFTALPGFATNPAFSPDGSRIAFAWSPGPGTSGLDQFDLYVKALGSETLLRLTQHPSESLGPAWSPDGTQIAFYREAGADSGIYVVPALGGPERKLRTTLGSRYSTISWSPDGKWIAFVDTEHRENHIYLLSMDTLQAKRIAIAPTCSGEAYPAFSHSSGQLAYWCYTAPFDSRLSVVSLSNGKSKVVSTFSHVPKGVAWSSDDRRLIVSNFNGAFELSEVSVADGSVKPLGLAGTWPAVSSVGERLTYSSFSFVANLWRRDLVHADRPALELVPSSRSQFDAQYSPDGKHIVFVSMRSGVQGVWVSNEDGSDLFQISDPDRASGSPQWSPDGKKIAFDSLFGDRWQIFVAEVAERKPRELITTIPSGIRPSWSSDGKWIYFASGESPWGIYRCPASGGDATVLSKDFHALDPRESVDGMMVYYSVPSSGDGRELKHVAVSGEPNTESGVDPSLRVITWTLTGRGIYFVPFEAPTSVRYLEFASKRIRTIIVGDDPFKSGLSVSPDGGWLLYSQQGKTTGDIMLADHFH